MVKYEGPFRRNSIYPDKDVVRRRFRVVGGSAVPAEKQPVAAFNEVSAGLFQTMAIPLLKGRHPGWRSSAKPLRGSSSQVKNPIGKLLLTCGSYTLGSS
jgi:hypothetical protein